MADEQSDRTSHIFVYEAEECCPCPSGGRNVNGYALLSDSVNEARLYASHVPCDPMHDLIAALVWHLLGYTGESRCEWFDEPGYHCWILRREGNVLHISVPHVWTRLPEGDYAWRDFSITYDFWEFTRKLRLYASRLVANQNISKHYRTVLRAGYAYTTLCERFEAHKREMAQKQSKR